MLITYWKIPTSLTLLLETFSLIHTTNFANRNQNNSGTVIGNTFIDVNKQDSYYIKPTTNGLMDKDAQVIPLINNKTDRNLL
jgi:hypothetical protein